MRITPDLAQLNSEQITKIQQLERELKVTLIAYEKLPKLADLNEDQLHNLQACESSLGVKLVAWK